MTDSQTHIETPEQKIKLERLENEDLILDIGGGGEGLVSRIEGDRVCALDIRMNEIREAQIHGHSTNWFVGDGRNLCFNDEIFDIVTLWFSLGYMSNWDTKREVLEEAYRVLKRNGRVSIMASRIPDIGASLIFWATFTFPDGTLSKTGYGIRGGQNQTLPRVLELISDIGFDQHKYEDHGEWFKLVSYRL
ncbi:MAG: class I SAM-dependent methyltransferase [Candidatus Thorarchaeota archaeon]|jgi:ubiquinone/menaquinone biosynthesis C-methylase UbiE